MGRIFFYSPHCDDETLSMGLAIVRYLAAGFDCHVVFMTAGGNGGPGSIFNGVTPCTYVHGGITHNPTQEQFASGATLDQAHVGAARLLEGTSAVGAMSTVTADPTKTKGQVFVHYGDPDTGPLPDGWGEPNAQPPTQAMIDLAKGIIVKYNALYPDSYHYTMSETDNHSEHSACGKALRQLKDTDSAYASSMFFVSRLYWNDADAIAQGLVTFPAPSAYKPGYDTVLRDRVQKAYYAWNPAGGSYAIGQHEVWGQFNNNFGAGVTITNKWHD
jgi:hypothetical protein